MILVCHAISLGQVIKLPCDFISRSLSKQISMLPSLVAIGSVVVKIVYLV